MGDKRWLVWDQQSLSSSSVQPLRGLPKYDWVLRGPSKEVYQATTSVSFINRGGVILEISKKYIIRLASNMPITFKKRIENIFSQGGTNIS